METEILKKVNNRENAIRFRIVTYPCIPENKYYVSEYGDIYDAYTEKFRAVITTARGYKSIELNNRRYAVHRLVAWEFKPDTRDLNLTVDHLDGDKLNNYYENLEWVTLSENIRRSYLTGLHGDIGYSDELIHEICELYVLGKSPIDVYRIIRNTNNTPRGNKKEEAFYRLLVSIRNKETRDDIVSQYDFPDNYDDGHRMPSGQTILSIDQIKIVAQLYVEGKRYVDILRTLNIDRNNKAFDQYYYIVMRICKRQSWTNITDPIFDNFKGEIVTVKNGGRFTEDQVRQLCELFRDYSKDPIKILSAIGIRKTSPDFERYYDGLMAIVHGKCWTRISKDYFTPTVFSNRQSHDVDEEFIFEMLNSGYTTRDIVRMYGLGSKNENVKLYGAIIDKVSKFRKIKSTSEFRLTKEDVENGMIDVWASRF